MQKNSNWALSSEDARYPSIDTRYGSLWVGRVCRVDTKTKIVDIEWLSFDGGRSDVYYGATYVGPRCGRLSDPEVGSVAICYWMRFTSSYKEPVPLIFLSPGIRDALNYDPVRRFYKTEYTKALPGKVDENGGQVGGKSIPLGYYEEFRLKSPKTYWGEIHDYSSLGAQMRLDRDTWLRDSGQDEVVLREETHTIYTNSLQRVHHTDAVSTYDGMISRSIGLKYYTDKELADHYYGSERIPTDNPPWYEHEDQGIDYQPDKAKELSVILSSTKPYWVRTLCGDQSFDVPYRKEDDQEIDETERLKCRPFGEQRRSVRELGDGILAVTEETSDLAFDEDIDRSLEAHKRDGYMIESSVGTLVGWVCRDEKRYGKVLRPQVFKEEKDSYARVDEIPIEMADAPHYTDYRYHATAAVWRMPHEWQWTSWYVDKEGHVFLSVGCSWEKDDCPFDPKKEHPLGPGRSVEAWFGGSVKAVIDKNRDQEESVILDTIGQMRFHLGMDDAEPSKKDSYKSTGLVRGGYKKEGGEDPNDWNLIHGVVRPSLTPGNNGAEMKSIIGTLDGGLVLRVGEDQGEVKRKFNKYGVRTEQRETDGEGDAPYRFHVMSQTDEAVGAPYVWHGQPIMDQDIAGHSADILLKDDMWLRIGKDDKDDKSLIIDLDGGAVARIGKEKNGWRSISVDCDGGAEVVLKKSKKCNGLDMHITGNVRIFVDGSVGEHVTGNYTQYIDGDYEQHVMGETRRVSDTEIIDQVTKSGKKIRHIHQAFTRDPAYHMSCVYADSGQNFDDGNEYDE